nr:hypothetical protein [Tanacetum cinerariifolium]
SWEYLHPLLSVNDSQILCRFLNKRFNLKVGRISHRSWVMGNDSLWRKASRSLGKTFRNSLNTGISSRYEIQSSFALITPYDQGYEIQSSFALITPYDQGFTIDRNVDDFLVGRIHSTKTGHHQSECPSPVGSVFMLGLLVSSVVAACASKAVVKLSATNFQMAA